MNKVINKIENMKTRLIIILLALSYNAKVLSQDGRIRDNISNAIENKGIEYFTNGTVRTIINISKIEYYYKWIKTADTLSAMDQFASWDFSSIKNFCNTYRNEKQNFDEQIKKCHLIAEKLKNLHSELKSDSMQIAHLSK
jgi:hypothetical protein